MSCGHIVDLDSGECLACGERRYTLVTYVECHTPDCDGGCKKAIAEREALNDAAPELLAALVELEAEMGVNYLPTFPKGVPEEIRAMLKNARAAIAKAEGRS